MPLNLVRWLPDLEVPKRVIVPNLRLSIFYYVLLFTVSVALIIRFVLHRPWQASVDIGEDMWAALMVGLENYTVLHHHYHKKSKKHVCTQTKQFEFWKSEELRFANLTCRPPCLPGNVHPRCVPTWDMAKPHHTTQMKNTWHFTTHVHDRVFDEDGNLIWTSNWFVPSVSGLEVSLSYGYKINMPNLFGQVPPIRGKPPIYRGANNDYVVGYPDFQRLDTVILNADGEFSHLVPFGQPLTFTLPKLLELAGDKHWLDRFHPSGGKNMLQGAAHNSPLVRLTGGELVIQLECTDNPDAISGVDFDSVNIPLCIISVSFGPRAWLFIHEVLHSQSMVQERDLYGLHVVVVSNGNFKHVDFNNIAVQLVIFLVLLAVPRGFVMFVMRYLLGNLSRVYRDVIYEDFPLRQMIAGLLTRMAAATTVFTMLCDVEDDEDSFGGGISKSSIKQRLQVIINHRKLLVSPAELNNVVDFVFLMMYRAQHDNPDDLDCDEVITLDGFMQAVSSLEKASLDNVMAVFDWSRKRHILERLFTPDDLRKDGLEAALWRHNISHTNTTRLQASTGKKKLKLSSGFEDTKQSAKKVEDLELERTLETQLRNQEKKLTTMKEHQHEAEAIMNEKVGDIDAQLKKAMGRLLGLLHDAQDKKIAQAFKEENNESNVGVNGKTSAPAPASTAMPAPASGSNDKDNGVSGSNSNGVNGKAFGPAAQPRLSPPPSHEPTPPPRISDAFAANVRASNSPTAQPNSASPVPCSPAPLTRQPRLSARPPPPASAENASARTSPVPAAQSKSTSLPAVSAATKTASPRNSPAPGAQPRSSPQAPATATASLGESEPGVQPIFDSAPRISSGTHPPATSAGGAAAAAAPKVSPKPATQSRMPSPPAPAASTGSTAASARGAATTSVSNRGAANASIATDLQSTNGTQRIRGAFENSEVELL